MTAIYEALTLKHIGLRVLMHEQRKRWVTDEPIRVKKSTVMVMRSNTHAQNVPYVTRQNQVRTAFERSLNVVVGNIYRTRHLIIKI